MILIITSVVDEEVQIISSLFLIPSFEIQLSYQIALHAATIPFIIMSLAIVSGFATPFPLFYSLVALVIIVLNLKKVAETSS